MAKRKRKAKRTRRRSTKATAIKTKAARSLKIVDVVSETRTGGEKVQAAAEFCATHGLPIPCAVCLKSKS